LDMTVFILSYNRPHFLREMLLSVLAQNALPEEIVILDNGSKEDTKKRIEDLIGGRVTWIGADHNHPSFWNFQRAFSLSDKKYFTIFHDDDRLLPDFLEHTVAELEADDSIIAITTNGHRIDGQGKRINKKLVECGSSRVTIFQNSKEASLQYSTSFIPFPNVVYRNGFPQKISIKEEYGKIWDSIFLIDLADQGKIALLNEPIFEYRIHGDQDSTIIPENSLQKMDEYIISKMESEEERRAARANVQRRQSKRFAGRMLITIIKRRDPGAFFMEYSGLENRYLSVRFVLCYLLFEQLNFVLHKITSK